MRRDCYKVIKVVVYIHMKLREKKNAKVVGTKEARREEYKGDNK